MLETNVHEAEMRFTPFNLKNRVEIQIDYLSIVTQRGEEEVINTRKNAKLTTKKAEKITSKLIRKSNFNVTSMV